MTTDEKLAAILAAVQTDPGNRGLARDPHDNLFTATKGDFEAACRELVSDRFVEIFTGFCIPSVEPPSEALETPFSWKTRSAASRKALKAPRASPRCASASPLTWRWTAASMLDGARA